MSAQPSAQSRILALDGYRALAALGIVAFHVLDSIVILRRHGGALVTITDGSIGNVLDAFFIISGFALFHRMILAGGELGSAKRFYWRRAARIYPAYWLMLCVLLALMAIQLPVGYLPWPPSASELAAQFSGFQKIFQLFDASLLIGFGLNAATWFVTVILCIYAIFPLIARAYYRHPVIGLVAAGLVSIAWKEGIAHAPGIIDTIQTHDTVLNAANVIDQFPGFAFSFGVGMTSAWAYQRLTAERSRSELERAAVRLAPVALAGLALAVYLFGHRAAPFQSAYAPTYARGSAYIPIIWSGAVGFAMLVVLLGPLWMRRPFESWPARRLSELSYAIFLIQAVIIIYLAYLFPGWAQNAHAIPVALFFLAVLTCSILYALASRRFVEVPVAEWASRREHRWRRAAPAAEAEAPMLEDPVGQP